jgi:parallel beta-helix repeat protein
MMKLAIGILILVISFIPFQTASAASLEQDTVTLTAGEVDSADDIEAAIIKATESGTRPGTVILDGQDGAFIFTGDDRSLNIFVSSLILRGMNQAEIVNCDDGLFFDDFPLQDILIESITFLCTGDGVEATGSFQDVTLSKNTFIAKNNGIGMAGNSTGWLIDGNLIQANGDGIRITGAQNVVITNNVISGNVGVGLMSASQMKVRRNTIQAAYQGILLGRESWKNVAQANTILGVSLAGISLEPGVVDNRIIANRVTCAPEMNCLTVEVLPEVAESNKIAGNKP